MHPIWIYILSLDSCIQREPMHPLWIQRFCMNHFGFTYTKGINGSTLDPWILHGSMHPIWIYEPLMDSCIQRESVDPLWIHGSYMDPCILYGSIYHHWIPVSKGNQWIYFGSTDPAWIHVSILYGSMNHCGYDTVLTSAQNDVTPHITPIYAFS